METKWMLGLVVMTALAMLVATKPLAGVLDTPAYLAGGECHALIGDAECIAFRVALTSMPPGADRERLINEYRLLIADRESACSCNQAALKEVRYPQVKQIALKL